jgi:hypothetical protein
MLSYLRCIKSHRGSNDPECRNLSKSYLSCRMDRYVPLRHICHMLPASTPHTAQTVLNRSCLLRNKQGGRRSCDTHHLSRSCKPGSRNTQEGGSRAAREICCSPHSLPLVASETPGLSNRHSSSHLSPSPQAFSRTAYLSAKKLVSPLPSVTPPRQHPNEAQHCLN